jgi:hypothetical protein
MYTKNNIIKKDETKRDFVVSLMINFIITKNPTIIGIAMEKTKNKSEMTNSFALSLYRNIIKKIPNKIG